MAEYYPLISRAVAGLRTGAPEAREAIYGRARQALVGQLRGLDPPIPEEAITREILALDEAIARAEADIVAASPTAVPSPVHQAPPAVVPADSTAAETEPSSTLDTSRPPRPPAPRPDTPPLVAAAVRRPLPPRPEMPRSPVRAPVLPPGIRPASPARSTPEPRIAAEPALDTEPPAAAPPLSIEPRGESSPPNLPSVATLKVGSTDRKTGEANEPETSAGEDSADSNDSVTTREPAAAEAQDERNRDESNRPAAPRPVEARRPNLRVWIVAGAALAAVVVIAFAAWRLRDNPQEVARAPAQVQTDTPSAGKIVERADGTAPASDAGDNGTIVALDQATRTTTEQAAATPQVGTPASDAKAPLASNTATPAPAASNPAIPVAYKAAILVDAPDLPEKVKTYIGTVVWRVENVTQGQDQPTGTGIRAEVDIPEAKTQLVVQIRRNTEAQFPASHTIDLKFAVATDGPLGTVKQINVPQMRLQDMPTGDPLAGIPVTIADNYFLVGLVRGTAEERNLELLRTRGWFDIPMLLANGKASKITFEKGSSGDRIFADVLNAWKAAQN